MVKSVANIRFVLLAAGLAVKGSEPTGITVAPNGDPWYTELAANKIATLALR